MAAAAVDTSYIGASYSVPETTLQSLLSAPTVELVQSLLVQIEAKAREYDDLKSERLRSEVELEAAVHNADTRARTLKSTADKAVKEAEELRQKLAREETARQQVETELQTLQATATSSTSQVHTFESRIKTLEAQNRDTVALHEAKSAAYDRLAEELSAQHQKFVTLRKQVSELEEKNQSLENAASSVKFRESNFQQEIELLRKNNDWYEAELKTRGADNTKFRKEKNAQIAELQRVNADANQTIDSLRSKEVSQTKRIEELDQRVEQSLIRIQQLQEEAAQNQESFRAELDNTRRLAALHQESANTVKKRLQEVQDQLTSTGDQAAEEIGRLQAEVESERNKATEYEGRVSELETVVENQEAQLSELRSSAHVPGTPRRVMNGSFDTPGRAGSPIAFSPGGSRLKGGLSTTQLYTENTKLKSDIRALQERDEKRSATMNEMLEELESRQPEIEELRQENERLTSETGEISALLEEAIAEKELARKETRKLQGDYQGLTRQRELDRQLIRDATFQSKLLLFQQQRQEQGLESLSSEEEQYLRETVNNEIPERLLDEDDTATSRLLSKHLVLFHNVSQLMEKNQELLRTIREVAEQYEGSEAQAKAAEQEKNREELNRLRDRVAQYEDEVKSLNLRSQGYMKERDMYRRIVTSRGHMNASADAASVFDQSIGDRATLTPPPGGATLAIEQTPRSKDVELIKELQARLDVVNEESATTIATLKHQLEDLAKEKRQMESENVRLTSKQDMAQQRFDYQQHRIGELESERSILQKRCEYLQDEYAKSDVQTQQIREDLVEARSQIDSLERANVNLKASQSIWESTKERLSEENTRMKEENTRLNKYLDDSRSVRNEQTITEAENRRLLQTRADSLDAELQNAKRKLDEEIEDRKRVSLRHELDQTEKQRKIDDLLKASNEVRQELASVKASRDQLQARVTELQTELRNAEARSVQHAPRVNGTADTTNDDLSREEQLQDQLAELQRNHDRAQQELEAVNENIENYKAIAQEAEEQLQSYVDTHEQYSQEMTRAVEEKDSKITDLEQRVEEISSELATTNSQLSDLRGTQEQENLRLTQQKELLEAEITRLKDDANDYKAEMEAQKQLVASQAEIATRAQSDYENELDKHGDTMKNLRSIREEYNTLKTEVTQYKAQAEAARLSLAQGEEHWNSTKERYDRELAEARARHNDLTEQNKTLYAQFDGLNAQVTSLQSSRVTVAAGQPEAVNLDAGLSGLQALNKTLRDDKDILQLQLSSKELELQRVQQDLAHKQEQLDQANEKLFAEQAQAQSRHSGANLQALQDNIEQLNLYRESNTTLRNEVQRLETERIEKNKQVETLQTQLQPLQARVLELEGELEINNGHIKALEEDRDRWQKRHQDVLQRYDRIDPKELEDLKKQIEELQAERDQALEQAGGADAQIQAAKDETKAMDERRQNVVAQAREKARSDKKTIEELKAEQDRLQTDLTQVQSELESANKDLESTRSELESVRAQRDDALAKVNTNADVTMAEEGQVEEDSPSLSAEEKKQLEDRVAAAEDRERQQSNQSVNLALQVEGLKERERTLENQVGELQERVRTLNTELSEAQNQKAQADTKVSELETRLASGGTTVVQPSEDIEKLKEELAARQKEVEDLRTQADMTDSLVDNGTTAQDPTAEQTVAAKAALEERESNLAKAEAELQQLKADVDQRNAELEKDAEIRSKERLEKMKAKANDLVKKERDVSNSLRNEIEELKRRLEQPASTQEQSTQGPPQEDAPKESTSSEIASVIKAEPLPGPETSERDIKDWIARNPVAQTIIKHNISKKLSEVKAEQDKSSAANAEEPAIVDKAEQEKLVAQKVEEATANVKAEHEKIIAKKVEDARASGKDETEKKFAARESLAKNRFNKLKAQWDTVEQAAKQTPEKPVKEVYDVAKAAKPPPAPPANAAQPSPQPPTAQAVQAVQSPSNQNAPTPSPANNAFSQQQQQPMANQANGAKPNPFGQSTFNQPGVGQMQGNPFAQSHGMGQNFPGQMQNQFGFGGLPQPGFAAQGQQPQFNQAQGRPNSPFAQQQQQPLPQQQQAQQGGRGRGGGDVGTGPAALRNIMGQQPGQSNIPRGGASNIPLPGGRGRGGGQQQQNQAGQQHPNAQGAGQSQIGRGGGRGGGGRGRGGGGGQGAPGSPLNPGAAQFQPGGGRGQGQKRGPEDDGAGGQRGGGGKRARGGGRGGGGGGAAANTGGGGESNE